MTWAAGHWFRRPLPFNAPESGRGRAWAFIRYDRRGNRAGPPRAAAWARPSSVSLVASLRATLVDDLAGGYLLAFTPTPFGGH